MLDLDVTLYGEDVVFKCFYWYGDNYDVTIARNGDDSLKVSISPKLDQLTQESLRLLESRIRQDLIDFKTRDIVTKETAIIRQLLVAKAFANNDELESLPPGTASGPGNDSSSDE